MSNLEVGKITGGLENSTLAFIGRA